MDIQGPRNTNLSVLDHSNKRSFPDARLGFRNMFLRAYDHLYFSLFSCPKSAQIGCFHDCPPPPDGLYFIDSIINLKPCHFPLCLYLRKSRRAHVVDRTSGPVGVVEARAARRIPPPMRPKPRMGRGPLGIFHNFYFASHTNGGRAYP